MSVEQLRDRLAQLEWSCDETFCPVCSKSKAQGHTGGCWLRAVLAEVKRLQVGMPVMITVADAQRKALLTQRLMLRSGAGVEWTFDPGASRVLQLARVIRIAADPIEET